MIGLFDSGTGGLTIAQECIKTLSEEAFLYLGDHRRAPYGQLANHDILQYTTEAVACLFDQDCDLVILACNTAAAVALRRIQRDWLPQNAPHKRVLGILVPTVEAVTGQSWHGQKIEDQDVERRHVIGVFATAKTVESESYIDEISKRAPHIDVVQIACPDLVSAIESHAAKDALEKLVKRAVDQLQDDLKGRSLDAVLLGCTHFPLVEHIFKAYLPQNIPLISQPRIVAQSLRAYLQRHVNLASGDRSLRGVSYLTTGDADHVMKTASNLCSLDAEFQNVDLTPYASSFSSV